MPADDLALLTEAARAAGKIAMGYFGSNPKSWHKGVDEPVSEADMAVDAMLQETLLAARPDYGWLSEESERDADRMAAGRCFIVDPIDGTRAFLAGKPEFAHALAVVEAGRVIAGAVHLPALGKTYAAAAGAGATRDGAALQVSDRAEVSGARVVANKAALRPENWCGAPPDVRLSFRPSLAYRICLVAEGYFDAAVTLRRAWEWDTAAASLIAAEAGAVVTDGHGRSMLFNSHDAAHDGLIAAGPALHAALMERRAGG